MRRARYRYRYDSCCEPPDNLVNRALSRLPIPRYHRNTCSVLLSSPATPAAAAGEDDDNGRGTSTT